MSRLRISLLTLIGCAVVVATVLTDVPRTEAQGPPHWASVGIPIDCTSQCHTLHHSLGDNLTSAATNSNLCLSCHNPSGLAPDLPISNADKAVPGVSGSSHGFEVAGVNPTYGAQLPLDADMQLRTPGGNIICSTCHNQHKALSTFGGESRIGNPAILTALGSTGTVAAGGTFTGAEGVWYLIEISTGGNENNSQFRYSKDNGISFFPAQAVGTGVTLDSGVTVSFSAGSYVVGERWEFSAAWPFLRAALDSAGAGSAICRDCHRSWDMNHTAVETWDGSPKSHPVGVALNANGRGYDRAVPLDGNGAPQGGAGADTNASNDLAFDASGNIQCLTCHGVHFVDSNTQTVDLP